MYILAHEISKKNVMIMLSNTIIVCNIRSICKKPNKHIITTLFSSFVYWACMMSTGHGITQYVNGELLYWGQAGAMNEGYR